MRKKLLLILLPILLCLAGFGIAGVRIKTENGKALIDLDALLLASEIGQPGSENAGEQAETEETEKTGETEETETEGKADSETAEEEKSVIRIIVYGKYVYKTAGSVLSYDRQTGSVENFDSLLKEIKRAGKVELIDNYAEAHAYRYVLEEIRKVKKAGDIILSEKE